MRTSLLFSILFLLTPINNSGLLSKKFVLTNNFKIYFTRYTITKMVTIILIINIVAKPFTELCPRINIMIAAMIVVTLASIMLVKLLLLPILNDSFKLFPINRFSFILSKHITLASTAIPIPSNIAAIPGKVNTPLIR